MKTTQFSTSAVRRAETDRGSKARLSNHQIEAIAAVEYIESTVPLLERVTAWFHRNKQEEGFVWGSELVREFKLHKGHSQSDTAIYAEDLSAFTAEHFSLKRHTAKERRIGETYGLQRPSFAAQAKCSPKPFQIWEAMFLIHAERAGLPKDRMGYDAMGHYGVNQWTIQSIWFLSGCKDSPKFRWLLSYEMRRKPEQDSSVRWIKKSHSLQECKDIMRGANWFACNSHGEMYYPNSKQLRDIGRVSLPLRHALIADMKSQWVPISGNRQKWTSRMADGQRLNYAFASEVQTWSKEQQAALLPAKSAHFYLGGNTEGWIAKQEAERLALDSTKLSDVLAECRRIVEACAGIIPTPSTHVIRMSEAVKVGCTYLTVRHGREANMNSETLGIALAILEAYEASITENQAA